MGLLDRLISRSPQSPSPQRTYVDHQNYIGACARTRFIESFEGCAANCQRLKRGHPTGPNAQGAHRSLERRLRTAGKILGDGQVPKPDEILWIEWAQPPAALQWTHGLHGF